MLPFPLLISVLFVAAVVVKGEVGNEVQVEGQVEGALIEKSMVQGGHGHQMNQQMQRPIQPMNQQYPSNQAPHNQYPPNQYPHNQHSNNQYPSHNQTPPIFQYPHQSGITPTDPTDNNDTNFLHADPWCTVDDPFADGALEALIADMDRKSRPERELGFPTMNEFARARQKGGRRARAVEDEDEEDESIDGQQMLGAYSPFHSVMDYNCPYAADEDDEFSSSASGYYYHHPAPTNKSRRSRRSASSKSISRLLDTLNNQPTNPFADQRKSRKSRRSAGGLESRMSRRSVSRPGSVNSMISVAGSEGHKKDTVKNLKNKKEKSKLKLKSKNHSKIQNKNKNKNKKNINGGRK